MNPPSAPPLALQLAHAADAVAAVRAGRSLTEALAQVPAPLRPGVQALAFHALRWLGSAEVMLRPLVQRRPPAWTDALLRTALTLLWPPAQADDDATQRAPHYAPHVLVDQAVAAARQRAPASAGFVNAVLRRVLRELGPRVDAALAQPLARWNHPDWWLQRLQADWPDAWRPVVEADNRHPPMTLRVNARRGDAAGYVARLAAAGLPAAVGPGFAPHAVQLALPAPVHALPGFDAGDVSVQDLAAQRAAPLLLDGLAPGARVLDACAAPGGKTAHLLEAADLDLVALDRDPQRLARVAETLTRLGLPAPGSCVALHAADAGDPGAWWAGRPFDAILLDAPCTASGIVRRHPDVRWLRRFGDVTALAREQARLLEALWPLLAPGGRLLYATCSVFKAEGQSQIDAFLQRHGDATLPSRPASPGHLLPLPDNGALGRDDALEPHRAAGDGFFLTLLEKSPTANAAASRHDPPPGDRPSRRAESGRRRGHGAGRGSSRAAAGGRRRGAGRG